MQDDQKQAPSGAHQQSSRYVELPRVVREVGPRSRRALPDAEPADPSPSDPARPDASWSKPETAASESESDPDAGRSDTFERRWEQVQSRFVDQVARAGRGRRRISRQAPVAAAALELVRGESMSRLSPGTTHRSRVPS